MNTLSKLIYGFSLCITLLLSALTVKAQNEDDIVRFLQAGQEDGGKLITAYISPMIEGFSYALNGAWFHTAKPHKLGGFDINIAVTPVFIPKSKDFFDPEALNMSTIVGYTNTTSPGSKAPTIIGPKDRTTYQIDFDGDQQADASFAGPQGLGVRKTLKVAPVGLPMLQVGVGLVKGTDLMVRFIPKTNIGSTDLNLIGFGVRHDVKQHIPGMKMLPFDLSVMAGYTTFKGVTNLAGLATEFPGTGQEAVYKFNAFMAEALISKKLAFVTFFGGVGFNGIKTKADVKGSYTFFDGTANEFSLTNPYSATFKSNSMRLDVGMRLNLLAFYIYGNYSVQEFNAFTTGLGFTFR
ncbi:MAG TPA: hypothetical protein PLV21_02910 [Cyclobacteriaceae bacterium]|nr:hypothetical protein [Cyclobacteriaceae bacterium]HRJ80806.1 hypothetical protein [Cyclobacteriaceae bacterium]